MGRKSYCVVDKEEVRRLVENGWSSGEIAVLFNIKHSYACKLIKEARAKKKAGAPSRTRLSETKSGSKADR